MNRYLKRTVRILSIDGGGIRGYIPALVLAELERRLNRLGRRKPLGTLFDFIAGTSTGSIITLGLSALKELANNVYLKSKTAFTTEQIVKMYEDHALLDRYFGRRGIADSLTNMLVTSYDIEQQKPLIMKKSPPSCEKKENPDYYIADAIKASSAAPTYFEPVKVSSIDGSKQYCLIDGGMFAGNPSMCAYVGAQRIYPNATNYAVFSLGTGDYFPNWTYEKVKKWGVLEWIQPTKKVPATVILNNGQAQAVDYHLSHLPKGEYHRLNIPLNGCSEDTDDAASENMNCLRERAQELILQHESSIARMVEMLK